MNKKSKVSPNTAIHPLEVMNNRTYIGKVLWKSLGPEKHASSK